MRFVRKFASLSAFERRLMIEALGALVRFRVALSTKPFPVIQRQLHDLKAAPLSLNSPAQIAGAVESMSRFVPASTCLVKALAAQLMLRRAGWTSDLHVGVVKEAGGALLAHAWVECDGAVLVGDDVKPHYTPILRSGA